MTFQWTVNKLLNNKWEHWLSSLSFRRNAGPEWKHREDIGRKEKVIELTVSKQVDCTALNTPNLNILRYMSAKQSILQQGHVVLGNYCRLAQLRNGTQTYVMGIAWILSSTVIRLILRRLRFTPGIIVSWLGCIILLVILIRRTIRHGLHPATSGGILLLQV